MGQGFEVAYLSHDDLRIAADRFLKGHHQSGSIPVPIEEIAEFQLGINIVPLPGLHDAFEIDGFTSADLKDISVDEFIYLRRVNRYRFTLAHEIGHVVLHEELYRGLSFSNVDGWKAFVNDIPEEQHRWFEWQAYTFGGLVLVPPPKLATKAQEAIEALRRHGVSPTPADYFWDIVADYLSRKFQVSSDVINKRLDKDGLKDTLPLPQDG